MGVASWFSSSLLDFELQNQSPADNATIKIMILMIITMLFFIKYFVTCYMLYATCFNFNISKNAVKKNLEKIRGLKIFFVTIYF